MSDPATDLLRIGSGPPLVLIGGLHGHFEFQRPVAEKLARDFEVFCFSLPGEDRPAESPETVSDVAQWLLARISSQELDQYFLCGISMGGIIALEMALQAPQRIARIASVVSFAEYNFLHPQLKRLFDFLLARSLEKTCRRLSRSTLLALTIRELLVERAHTSVMRAYWNRFQKYHSSPELIWTRLRMLRATSLLDRVSQLSMPVLLVAAQRDRLVHPDHTLQIAPRIPRAKLELISSSGHLFPYLRPERFAQIVAPFFKSEPRA